MTRKIVAFVGFKGCGKNSAAETLIEHGYTSFAFADALKDTVAAIYCWDRDMLSGDTEESRIWRETVDEWWAAKLGIPDFTPRMALQIVGTDLFRNHFHRDIWLMNMERRISMVEGDIVITDCRFANELDLARSLGGCVIRVQRGADPNWYSVAAMANSSRNTTMMEEFGIHSSEWSWIGTDIDYTIHNNGTREELKIQVQKFLDEKYI